MLTVSNQTSNEWRNVENTAEHVLSRGRGVDPAGWSLRVHSTRLQPASASGFNFHRMQIRDLRLAATLPDGKPLDMKKKFEKGASKAPSKALEDPLMAKLKSELEVPAARAARRSSWST